VGVGGKSNSANKILAGSNHIVLAKRLRPQTAAGSARSQIRTLTLTEQETSKVFDFFRKLPGLHEYRPFGDKTTKNDRIRVQTIDYVVLKIVSEIPKLARHQRKMAV
jgi:hypothetical protein